MGLFDKLFGGVDTSAQDYQLAQNREAKDVINRNADRAREDVMRLFPQAQNTLAQGTQAALDVFGQAIPQQMSAFQQGNMQAQDAQLSGLSAIQRALMGQPLDLATSMRTFGAPNRVAFDPSFAQQRVPEFIYGGAGMQGQGAAPQQGAAQSPPNIEELIRQLLSTALSGRV